MSSLHKDLKQELIRFQTSYIELIHHTSSEIAKLKLIIKLGSQQQRDVDVIPGLSIYNETDKKTEVTLFKSSEKTTNIQSYQQQIDDLRDAKIALIQSTSFEINRLRNIIKYITMNDDGDGVDGDDDIKINEKKRDDQDANINKFEVETNHNKPTEFNWNEIVKHNKKNDLWLVYDNKVFDITSFLSFHPGGIEVILDIASKSQDITKVFTKLKHPPVADRIIVQHYIGNVCNQTAYNRMSMDLSGIIPIWEDDNLNVNNINSLQHQQQQQHCNMKMQCVIGWNDIFSVKIAVLDKQHENLMNLINDIYNFYEVKYLLEFQKRWDVHCKTEETLFEYYNFDETTALQHIVAHKEIYHFIKDEITGIRIKYNGQQPQCKELIDWASKMSVIFKDHHFEFDKKYIHHLDEPILNSL